MGTSRDLRHFGQKMRRVAVAIENDITDFKKDVVVQVQSAVIEGTPVDVGTARSNWVVRVGSPFNFVYRAFAPGSQLGRGERGNMEAARRQGANAVASLKGEEPIYISNNLPYIGALNRGHSPQAARGYVQRAISSGMRSAISRFRMRNVERLI